MDKGLSNINTEFTISKAIADQLIDKARSFRHKCAKEVKDMQDAHIEKIRKRRGLKDRDYDIEEPERRVAKYMSIIYNHSLRDWFPSPYDPNQLITLFSCLRIKEGYHLGAYQYLDRTGNGRANIFVISEKRTLPKRPPQKVLNDSAWQSLSAGMGFSDDMPQWKRTLRNVKHFLYGIFLPYYRSLPKWADSEIENYIEGDGSPLSYFQASIFFRELYELGSRRKLPYKADSLKVEFSVYFCITSRGVMFSNASWGRLSL